jgi:uncharacterized repeat protein (TIGR01451 family)
LSSDYGDEYWQEDYRMAEVPLNRPQGNPNPFTQHNAWGHEPVGNQNVDPYAQPYPQPRTAQRPPSQYEIDEAQKKTLYRENNRDGIATTNPNNRPWATQQQTTPQPSPSTHSSHFAQNVPNRQPSTATTEKQLTVSPLIEVATACDSKAVVGREMRYRIHVSNKGGATAEQVVLTVEIPNWLKFQLSEVTSGVTEIKEVRKENPKLGLRNFVWTIGKIEPSQEEWIELLLVPQECRAIDLKIHHDFHKPSIVTQIVVEEAVLEMELQGADEILWGTKVVYTLVVRNTGSGDAEQVKLELMETGSELREYTFPLIKAGEEKAILVDVYAGKLQKNVDINIQASSAYDVNAKIMKKVKILRPEVTMFVDMAETQFVGSPAEFLVKVKNSGDAEAKNLDLAVTIPIGTKFISSTNNGELTPQNQVRWSIESLPVNGEFIASVVCTPHREGVCKIDTILMDKEDSVAKCTSVFTAEAISDLRMSVEPPNGPIEVGQDAVFVINVTNRGTKLASNVALFLYCSSGLKPISTLGDKNRIGNGVVEFDVIPSISAGQTVTMKVVTKAEYGGNHRIRAELISPYTADVAAGKVEPQTKLLSEQTLSFYQRKGIVSTRQANNKPETQPIPNTPTAPTEEPITVDPFPQ